MLLNVVSGILTARFLGPEGKGELTALLLWPGLISAVGSLGLFEAITYFTGKETKGKIGSIFSNSILASVAQSILLIGIGYLILPRLMNKYDADAVHMSRALLIFIPINLLALYINSIFQGKLLIKYYNRTRLLVYLVYVIGIVLLSVTGRLSIYSCALVWILANLTTLSFEFIWIWRLGYIHWSVDLPLLYRMINYGVKAYIGNLSSILNIRLDQLILAIVVSPALFGFYVVAFTISGGASLVSGAVASIALPTVSSISSLENKLISFARFLRFDLWISVMVSLVLFLILPWFLPLLFGDAFIPSIPAARILVFAGVISGMNNVMSAGLKGCGMPLVSTLGEVITLIATLFFLSVLIPKYQIYGAALASFFSYSVGFICLCWLVRLNLGLKPSSFILPQQEDMLFMMSSFRRLRIINKNHIVR